MNTVKAPGISTNGHAPVHRPRELKDKAWPVTTTSTSASGVSLTERQVVLVTGIEESE